MNEPLVIGSVFQRGKTKQLLHIKGQEGIGHAIARSTDNITAGDGKRKDKILGKGAVSNTTTCNVFRFLQLCGVPVAFKAQTSPSDMLIELCDMLPIEVVVRRTTEGSALKRQPHLPKGHILPKLTVEYYLKTSGKQWKGKRIPVDDPKMKIVGYEVELYRPDKPIHGQEPFLRINLRDIIGGRDPSILEHMAEITYRTFLLLEKAYLLAGNFELIDMKVEFGINWQGHLRLADVIDAESIRLKRDGKNYDKQPYRDGGLNPDIMPRFQEVCDATARFTIPAQRIIIWTGSPDDDTKPVVDALTKILAGAKKIPSIVTIAQSIHKETCQGIERLDRLVQETPHCVIIALIGMSNGAGPTLSAHTTVPVITCPAMFEKFPDDIWSSLRTPSKVPVSTIISPANAALHALQILALSNPLLYAVLRTEVEKRRVNTVPIAL